MKYALLAAALMCAASVPAAAQVDETTQEEMYLACAEAWSPQAMLKAPDLSTLTEEQFRVFKRGLLVAAMDKYNINTSRSQVDAMEVLCGFYFRGVGDAMDFVLAAVPNQVDPVPLAPSGG